MFEFNWAPCLSLFAQPGNREIGLSVPLWYRCEKDPSKVRQNFHNIVVLMDFVPPYMTPGPQIISWLRTGRQDNRTRSETGALVSAWGRHCAGACVHSQLASASGDVVLVPHLTDKKTELQGQTQARDTRLEVLFCINLLFCGPRISCS